MQRQNNLCSDGSASFRSAVILRSERRGKHIQFVRDDELGLFVRSFSSFSHVVQRLPKKKSLLLSHKKIVACARDDFFDDPFLCRERVVAIVSILVQ